MDKPSSLSELRPANTTPLGNSRSAQAKVNAFLCITMFCADTVPVLLNGVTTAVALVEAKLTFWNCPAVMMAGLTVTEVVPEVATVTAAVTTKLRNLLLP